jgi:ribosomal protein L32
VDGNTAGRVSLGTYAPWLIALAGVLMLAAGLYYYYRGQPRTRSSRRRHIPAAEPAQGARYCPQCGTRARPGDKFCRTCGTRIRPGEEE